MGAERPAQLAQYVVPISIPVLDAPKGRLLLMYHIAFMMLPEPGHILPTLQVARRLQARGHRVSYVSLPSLAAFFTGSGFEFIPIMAGVCDWPATDDIFHAPSGVTFQQCLLSYLGRTGATLYDLLVPPMRCITIDVLVCDSVLLHNLHFPFHRHIAAPVVSLSVYLPYFPLKDLGVREIILCPIEFEIPSAANSLLDHGRMAFAEPSLFEKRNPVEFPWNRLKPDRLLVLCSFGTQTLRYPDRERALHSVLEAMAQLPQCQLVLSGKPASRDIRDMLQRCTDAIVAPVIPQIGILRCASLFITHGGMGGLKEAVMNGVPILVVPFDLDQPRNAKRVVHHRLGRACRPQDCTGPRVRGLIEDILTDSVIHGKMSAMRAVFWTHELVQPSVPYLEAVAAGAL